MRATTLGLSVVLTLGIAASGSAQPFGPADGAGLTATDTGRVRAGMSAPDFRLESFSGAPVSLSQYRGKKNVVLAFYRGHW